MQKEIEPQLEILSPEDRFSYTPFTLELFSDKIISSLRHQDEVRTYWRDGYSPEGIDFCIIEETQELIEAIEIAKIGGSIFEVASEIGDISNFGIKRTLKFPEVPIPDLVQAALDWNVYVAQSMGIDLNESAWMKIVRNEEKYPSLFLSNGVSGSEMMKRLKQAYKDKGGDVAFSHWYLNAYTLIDAP